MGKVTINCDMGEAFGIYAFGDDEACMPYITHANVACGFHASDPSVMWRTVRAAKKHRIAVGSHPGLNDREGFGRRENTGAISTELAPFGGVKESGLGREGSHYGVEEFVEVKYLLMGGLDR